MSDDLVELAKRLKEPIHNEKRMGWWDDWRAYITKGGGGSWPRDSFESVLDFADEERGEAAEAIERLTKERDEARQESLDNYGQGIKRGALQMRERAAQCQPCTAENPREDAYQHGRFDGIMEFGRAIRNLPLEESK